MNADGQAPDGEPPGVQPGPPPAAAGSGHAESTEAGGPRERGQGPGRGFWNLLSQAERTALHALGQVRAFRAGDILRTEGEETTDVLVLTAGWVKVLSVTRQHREIVLALRGPGEIVGELAGSCTGYRTATVAALTPVHALVVTHEKFSLFLDSSPQADKAYRSTLAHRWYEAADMLRSRSLDNGAQRLAGLLLDLAARHGTPAGPATVITIPLTQDEIASLIGTSRATVTRALRDCRHHNLISTARHQITIKDTPALRSLADRDTHAPDPS
jgi:CRP/FNR family cyclic AMP-dependent transcriptional regulator